MFINSAIHKATGRAVPGFASYNYCGTEKCPLAVNGSHRQERPPEVVLYGGRPYGGFVNSAVKHEEHSKSPRTPGLWIFKMISDKGNEKCHHRLLTHRIDGIA